MPDLIVTKDDGSALDEKEEEFLNFKKPIINTHISFILDGSSSMRSCLKETILGFNTYLKDTIDSLTSYCLFTFGVFQDYGIRNRCDKRPIEDVFGIDQMTYVPSGGTPLYDSLAKAIAGMEVFVKSQEGYQPIIVIQTDGYDTTSRDFDLVDVAKMVKEKKKQGWIFILIGAKIDAERLGSSMNIEKERCLSYSDHKSLDAFVALANLTKKIAKAERGEPVFSIEDKRNVK